MGAWSHDFFGNDGAQDLIARLAGLQASAFHQVLEEAAGDFARFLDRDEQGLTFRALSQDELSENDRLIRDALSDIPELLAQWDDSDAGGDPEILADTGDHEAQALIAALAIGIHGMHETGIKLPKDVALPAGFRMSEGLLNVLRGHVEVLLSHPKLRGQFSSKWLGNVVKLKEMVDRF